MPLYHQQYIQWDLRIGDLVGYIKHPFFEYKIDPIFKVVGVSEDNMTMDIEVYISSFLVQGSLYPNQPTWGFRKVKETPIDTDLTYKYDV